VVRPPAIFLRNNCVLPDGLHLKQKPYSSAWMSVENAAPAQLDLAVRDAGWHFMWIEAACTCVGYGRTDEAAITRAGTRERFNAAELSVVRVSRYFGLHIAKATLHTRHIQQSAALGLLDGVPIRQLA
jgi:hypothetical protein